MTQQEHLITQFYKAFQNLNYGEMQRAYHAEATFSDPVFQNLNAGEVKAMWQMLLTSAKDLKIVFSDIHADEHQGRASWEAWYTFSKTGRPVHNIVRSSFDFKDGRIFSQQDSFDLWRWSRQALGISGLLLGWSPLVQNKIRGTARASLKKFMA